jgi:hypothetical protein
MINYTYFVYKYLHIINFMNVIWDEGQIYVLVTGTRFISTYNTE